MKYKLIYASDLKRLERVVNEHIAKGYVPQGGAGSAAAVYIQAMVLHEAGPSEEDVAAAKKAATAAKSAATKAATKARKDQLAADEAAASEEE